MGQGGTDILPEDLLVPQSSALYVESHPQRTHGGSGHGWPSGTPCAVIVSGVFATTVF